MQYSSITQEKGSLRDYQIKAKKQIFEAWDNYDSLMLQMPTGTGKTYLFTSLINDLLKHYKTSHKELNILVVAHRMELINQIGESLNQNGIPCGYIQGSREQHLWQRVQVGSIMSLLTCKNEYNVKLLDFDYIIVDEAHHSLADTYKKLFETFPKAKKLGVTATPWRFNHETFTSLYQVLITTPQVSWFIKNGVLADFDYVSIKPDSGIQKMINNTEIADTGDFVNKELEESFNNQRIRSKVFASYKKFANGRKGIIYAISKVHASMLADLYTSKGVKAVAIDCDTPTEERKQLIEDFKYGVIQVLVNVNIFTEGFNCPDVSFIQLARPTRSLALYLQQVGRGLRIAKGKEKTIIIDNVGLYNYFGLPDANRQWNRHFIGHEVPDEITFPEGGIRDISLSNIQEKTYDEDDEPMMIVRGSGATPVLAEETMQKTEETPLPIEEFSLADYYLVRGNKKAFKVYPFIKVRGKNTEGVRNCVYEYDESMQKIEFGNDYRENLEKLASMPKAQTIVMFVASLKGKSTQEIMKSKGKNTSLFELLRNIEKKD